MIRWMPSFITDSPKLSKKFHAGQSQIGQNLLLVRFADLFDRLRFDDHLVFDNDVGAESLVKPDAIDLDRDWHLPLHREAGLCQSIGEHYFIDCLQKPRPRATYAAELND